jgi:hypothetical protein
MLDLKTKLREQIDHVRRTHSPDEIAVPFVPYAGKHFNDAHTEMKVLIVGKATDGWGWSAGAGTKPPPCGTST